MTEITQIISTVGFPIVACIAMYAQQREFVTAIRENTEKLAELSAKVEGVKE